MSDTPNDQQEAARNAADATQAYQRDNNASIAQQETAQTAAVSTGAPEVAQDTPGTPTGDQEPQTYDAAYVKALRDEAAGHRVKAKRSDDLAARLVTSIAAGTGKLADARDLPHGEHLLDADGLPDPDKIGDAIDALIRERPHLASRRPTGHLEQGARPEEPGLSLVGLLRGTG